MTKSSNPPLVTIWLLLLSFTVGGCSRVTTRVNPEGIAGEEDSIVTAKVFDDGRPQAGTEVAFKVIDGEECGSLSSPSAVTDENGRAWVIFTGAVGVENCRATIQASAAGENRQAFVTVNPLSPSRIRLDGVSAIAVILIASFAIDRIVRGALFLLSFWPVWASRFPDPESSPSPLQARRRQQLAYFLLAGALGILVLGWYGRLRILSAMGFIAVNPILDALITGLILVGGADRTEAVLQKLGAGSPAEAGASSSVPLEVTGRLTIDQEDRGKKGGDG